MNKHKGSTLNLLLKNSFRNTVNSWPVVLGLTLLIALLSLVISLMTSIGTRVVDNYHDLDRASNLRDAVVDLNMTDLVNSRDDYGQNNVENQQAYLYDLEKQYKSSDTEKKYDFYWSRTEGRNFPGVMNNGNDLKIKIVAKTTPDVSKEAVDQLAISEGRNIVYNHDQVDPVTKQPLADHIHETVMDATFAKKNNIKIGDIIRVQEDDLGNQLLVKSDKNNTKNLTDAKRKEIKKIKDLSDPSDPFNTEFSTYNWLQVVGFGESSDFTMPVIDSQTPMPNKSTQFVTYVNPHIMGLYKDKNPVNNETGFVQLDLTKSVLQVQSASDEESYYSLKFKDANFKATKDDIYKMNEDFNQVLNKSNKDDGSKATKRYIYLNGDPDYQFASRTSAVKKTIQVYETIAGVIFAVVALIVLFSVVLISKKQIDKTRSQIGVMKALGYSKRRIVWNYVTMPFISALLGGIIGFIISQAIQGTFINIFVEYFNLDISGWSFDVPGFFIDVVCMWFVVTAVGFGIAYWVMRADTLELLNAAKASHISPLALKLKSLNKSPNITSQMISSLLASNSGKMVSVTLIVLIATIIMTATFTLPTVLGDNKTKSYTGLNYKQVVEYNDPVYNNPYTFQKTWDPEIKDQNFKFSTKLSKMTANPLTADGDYDYSKIMGQLLTGKISSEYYDLEFGASPTDLTKQLPETYTDVDGTVWTKSVDGTKVTYTSSDGRTRTADASTKDIDGIPNALQGMTANMKMLQMYGVTLSNKYFKAISDWAVKDSFGWNILANQWPDYLNFSQALQDIANKAGQYANLTEDEQWEATFGQLQNFYKKYIESVGLVVTRDYYNYTSNDAVAVTSGKYKGKSLVPSKAYEGIDDKGNKGDKDYDAQIDLFNTNNSNGISAAFESYKDEKSAKNDPSFGQLLVGNSLQVSKNFQIADSTAHVAQNHIVDTDVINAMGHNPDSQIDPFLTDSAQAIMKKGGRELLQKYIADYLTWYGAFFSQRSGTAIVQAGFSRPPYFVEQYAKKAYYANDNNDVYRFSFSSVPFNPDLDQLGVEMTAQKVYNNKTAKFNIYGIQNNNKFVDLKDSDGNNLVSKLFNDTDSMKYDEPGIVINESLATKLNLKAGQDVDFDIISQELQKNGNPYKTTDWKQPNPRTNADTRTNGWISMNDMDTFNINVNDPNSSNSVAFTAGNTNLTNAPSEFYQQWLKGQIDNKDVTQTKKFKILGIHDGYGTPAAWVRNQDAESILKYDQSKAFLWDTLFRKQFGDTFAYKDPTKNSGAADALSDYRLSESATKHLYSDSKGGIGNTLIDYKTFKSFLDTNPITGLANELSKTDQDKVKNIEKIFENAYPIFNYKYSMSADIGDLQAAVSTWDKTGGYSPIEENGGTFNGQAVNAIGQGALASLIPVEISKQMLNQMSQVIMAVVIIIIVLVIILTFIIIMLTTSLIISDNVRFIATMKVLGYSTTQIVDTVLGMYAVSIVCSYVVGFIIGWFMLSSIVHTMAMTTSFVLPLLFPWWLIFAVALAVCGIYIITFVIGFVRIQRTNPLDALKDMEI